MPDQPITIIPYEPKYSHYFTQLNRAWIEELFVLEPVDIKTIENPKQHILDPGGHIVFAKYQDKIVGTCALSKDSDGWELTKMAVLKGLQGKGIGRLMGEAIIEHARTMDLKKIHLVTNSGLKPAIHLYYKLGFKLISDQPHPKYQRGDYLMELIL